MELAELMEEYQNQEKLYSSEGRRGVENLCRIVHAMGYRDRQHFGQFHQAGSLGDLIEFLEDNPGCVETIKDWICEQNIPEWAEELESNLNEKPE
jgi:hypothetical protein